MIALFLFYDMANGKQAWMAFSKKFRHCNVITYDGKHWVLIDMDRLGIHTRVLDAKSATALMRGLKKIKYLTAMVCVEIDKPKRISWKPLWGRTCNELCRYATGVDTGLTFNPIGLYKKLLKYNGKRNYEILDAWRRRDG